MKGKDPEFHYFHTDGYLEYDCLCDDFGPMNIACVIRFIGLLEDKLRLYPTKKLVYLVGKGRRNFTNSAFMIGAYAIFKMNLEPDDVLKIFESVDPNYFEAFRDATFSKQDFDLTLVDCWRALCRARNLGWFTLPTSSGLWGQVDLVEYEHYENPLNGDLVEVNLNITVCVCDFAACELICTLER
jgi:cell division cycle 14